MKIPNRVTYLWFKPREEFEEGYVPREEFEEGYLPREEFEQGCMSPESTQRLFFKGGGVDRGGK